MKIFLILFLLIYSSISFSKEIPSNNSNIVKSQQTETNKPEEFLTSLYFLKNSIKDAEKHFDDELEIKDEYVVEQEKIFKKILKILKSNKELKTPDFESEIFYLNRKMQANKSAGYHLAYNRDLVRLESIKNEMFLISSLNKVISLRKEFASKEKIKKEISSLIEIINSSSLGDEIESCFNENKEQKGKVAEAFVQNFVEYKNNLNLYLLILEYLEANAIELYNSNPLVQNLSIDYWANKINQEKSLEEVNFLLSYTKTDFGRLFFALIVLILINSLRIFLIPLIITFIKKSVETKEKKINDARTRKYLIKSASFPAKVILAIFSIEMAIRVIHNNQFDIEEISILFNSLYAITFAVLVYNLLNEWLNFYSKDFFSNYPHIRKEMIGFFIKFAKIGLFIIVLLFTLSEFGFNVKAIIASLGVGGIAVALAAKDSLTNIFGGISIMLDDSLRQGDWIVHGDVEGTVIEIRMRTTTIRTFDNAFVTVPNSQLASGSIKNWNRRVIGRRIKMYIGVTYESDPIDIKNAIDDIKKMLIDHENITSEEKVTHSIEKHEKLTKLDDEYGIKKTLLVHADSFQASSIDIQVYCFSEPVEWEKWLDIKQDVMFKIIEIINANNLEFAYPTSVNWLKADNSNPEAKLIIKS